MSDGAYPQDHGSTPDLTGGQLADISRRIVQIYAEFAGRGPTKARTVAGRDMVAVVLSECLTTLERQLADGGRELEVLRARRALQDTMRERMSAVIEEVTERKVITFLSDQTIQPDYAIEAFVLQPEPQTEG